MPDVNQSLAAHDLSLRAAIPADGKLVLWLEEVAMKDHAITLWGTWRPSAVLEDLDLSTHEIIAFEGNEIGCLATRILDEALVLTRLYLAPNVRNRGIGRHILRSVIERADARRLPVRLRVLTTNPALSFYQREGFKVLSKTPEHFLMIREYIRPPGT